MKFFPIMTYRDYGGNQLTSIPFAMIEGCELQAKKNHGQSLKRLAERGGLAACEALAVLNGKKWEKMEPEVSTSTLQVKVDLFIRPTN